MSFTRKKIAVEEYHYWDSFIDIHPQGTIFHKTCWLNLIGGEIEIFTLWDNEKIRAGVALVRTKKNRLTGYHIPPYTQYFSPLYLSDNPKKISLSEEHDCIAAVLQMIPSATHIDFKLPKGHQSILPYHWSGFDTSVSLTHTISGSLAAYLQELNKNKARELKKLLLLVESGEISIENELKEAELEKLLSQTGQRKGFDPRSALAVNIVMNSDDSFAKKIVIRSAVHGIIAFGFFPYDNKAVYNLINASIPVKDPVLKTINLLLIYQAIEFALNSNRVFDFEGSMLPGVEIFYRLMGGTQIPVYRVQKSPGLTYSILRAAKQIKNDRKKT